MFGLFNMWSLYLKRDMYSPSKEGRYAIYQMQHVFSMSHFGELLFYNATYNHNITFVNNQVAFNVNYMGVTTVWTVLVAKFNNPDILTISKYKTLYYPSICL